MSNIIMAKCVPTYNGFMALARRAKVLALLFIIIGIQGNHQAKADDFGFWEFYTFRWTPARTWEINFYPELIYDQDAGHLSYLLLNGAVHYFPSSKLDIGLVYSFVRTRTTNDVFVTQHWESPEITIKQKLWIFPLSYRNKMEMRQMHGATDRYRGRIGLNSPFSLTPLKITPYISHEIFYDFYQTAVNQTRTTVGFSIPIDARVQWNVFYLRQGILQRADWRHVGYAGSDIRILIGPEK